MTLSPDKIKEQMNETEFATDQGPISANSEHLELVSPAGETAEKLSDATRICGDSLTGAGRIPVVAAVIFSVGFDPSASAAKQ
jgi:hypothetical protein